MASLNKKNFDSPDETMTPEKMKVDSVDLGNGVKAARLTTQPGWKWSNDIKPVVGTESCQATHLGVIITGTVKAIHNDGTEATYTAGDAYSIQPGHDGMVVGDEPAIVYEFAGAWGE